MLQQKYSSSLMHGRSGTGKSSMSMKMRIARGELRTILYGYARVPYLPGQTQGMKQEYDSQDEDRAKEEISSFIK